METLQAYLGTIQVKKHVGLMLHWVAKGVDIKYRGNTTM